MHLGWSLDERPRWAVALVFQVLGPSPGRPGAHRLEDAIVATGKARLPGVRFGGGEIRVTLVVKGADDVDATATALAVVDSAVHQVPGLALGDLLSHAARPRTISR